jgi:uncharacterized protein
MTVKFPRATIIQFAKAPERATVKTRLSPALDENARLELHGLLVRLCHDMVVSSRLARVEVWTNKLDLRHQNFWDACGIADCELQQGRDLGERMHHAFGRVLCPGAGNEFALIIGSDCPFITPGILEQAMSSLEAGNDAVIGPAEDGGYYLIGLRKPDFDLFRHIPWGTDSVCSDTRRRLSELDLQYQELPALPDIDRPEDLRLLANLPAGDREKLEKFITS